MFCWHLQIKGSLHSTSAVFIKRDKTQYAYKVMILGRTRKQ